MQQTTITGRIIDEAQQVTQTAWEQIRSLSHQPRPASRFYVQGRQHGKSRFHQMVKDYMALAPMLCYAQRNFGKVHVTREQRPSALPSPIAEASRMALQSMGDSRGLNTYLRELDLIRQNSIL